MNPTLALAFDQQALACDSLGSPFMARMMRCIPQVWPQAGFLSDRVEGMSGDLGPRGASVPLRVAGGLHALVLADRAPDLSAVFAPHAVTDAELAWAIGQALIGQDSFLSDWITTPPQTNEIGRSAVLMAAASDLSARFALPLVLSELGASAGLNLWFDKYALSVPGGQIGAIDSPIQLYPDWSGPSPAVAPIHIAARRGVDLHPLDPGTDGARLLAFTWADQPERLSRLRAALAVASGGVVDAGDAADWLDARVALPVQGRLHLVFHTIAYQYFPSQTQARIQTAMEAAGARAHADAPLAWLGMEADGAGEGAAVTLRLWPGDVRLSLGRAGFHGQWVRWSGALGVGG
ncbi:MAG: DUF2332 domain-containing protein [Paracoccaceae bacterium]